MSVSRWPSPDAPATWVRTRTSMVGTDAIRATRYCDMVASSDPDRTRSTTRLAKRDRFSAAWPAELAAPTM